ncbi:MAG: DNA topoisomerase subunit B [Clostridia bacterium]
MLDNYTVSDIKVMEGLEAVRMRPGMYIGSTGARGLHHLLFEIVDNAVDEAANGFANEIIVTLHKDASVTVFDNGRGIPVGIHEKLGVSGVEVVFTQLHAGGKFGNESYGYSGGLHGVGASVVNALSKYVLVEVYIDGRIYSQKFHSYRDENGKMHSGKPEAPLKETGRTRKRGSSICFLPDKEVFETLEMNFETISKRIKELAYLNKGVMFKLIDERADAIKQREYCFEGGIVDFIKQLNLDKIVLYEQPILLTGKKDDIIVEIAFQHNDGFTENIFSYVNNIPTTEGGTHEIGFRVAFTKVMNDYCRKIGALKDKDLSLVGEDFREGLTAVLSLKMRNVQFEGQTKTRLGNTEARPAVECVLSDQLSAFLEDLKNGETANLMIDKAMKAMKVREAARKAKTMAREKSKLENAPLVGKLSSCTGRDRTKNELFIVEGDSAGGSAKQGRDRSFQAILPLRGKPLNVEKKRMDQVLANEEIRSIITAVGTGISSDFTLETLKYDKIIILSDADQDGAHIRAILLTFFYRYMKELITSGHVYIGLPPLYKVQRGKDITYAYSDNELLTYTKGIKNYDLQRYKGLGEMNPSQLWETTMNPENRSLIQVTIEDAADVEQMVTILMGDKAQSRKEYISEHANFNKKDDFIKYEEKHGKEER